MNTDWVATTLRVVGALFGLLAAFLALSVLGNLAVGNYEGAFVLLVGCLVSAAVAATLFGVARVAHANK